MGKNYLVNSKLEIDQLEDCTENIVLYLVLFINIKGNVIMHRSLY